MIFILYKNKIIKIILFFCLIILIFSLFFTPILESTDFSFVYQHNAYYYKDIQELKLQLEDTKERKKYAKEMADAARKLGYKEDHKIIQTAKKEWNEANEEYLKYKLIIETLEQMHQEYWQDRMKEYPEATTIWIYLKEKGFNDYVAAGIMGNLMAETGGQTLNIKSKSYSSNKSYYGICQWSATYKAIWDKDLDEQLDYLLSTISYEFDVFGYAYKKDFNYESFLKLTDEKEAAKAFSKCYERCGSSSISVREKNATIALKYFTNKDKEN